MATTMQGFARVVSALEPHHWDLPTPCTGWSVFDVVDHVVMGERFTAGTLAGASLAEATEAQAGIDRQDPDVTAQVERAAADLLFAFDESLDRLIEHRIGPVTARRVLGFRIIDELGHTWDVATATGQDALLVADALVVGLEVAVAERETLERSANFETVPGAVGATVDPQTAFLHAIGRAARTASR